MAFLSRRTTLPAEVLAALDLLPGERVLAVAGTVERQHVVATDRHLWVPQRGAYRGLAWEAVERAGWDRDSGVLSVVATAAPGAAPVTHALRVEEPGRLVDVVREQVNASVVLSRHLPVAGDLGVRVTGRRRPAGDRRPGLTWAAVVDRGLDLQDPAVRAAVDAAVASVRAEVGE